MLRILGYPHAEGSGSFPSRGFEVLAYVILARHRMATREEVASLLWSEVDRPNAFANLRFVLAGIRRWEKTSGAKVLQTSKRELQSAGGTDLDQLQDLGGEKTVSARELLPFMQSGLLSGVRGDGVEHLSWLATARANVEALQVELALRAVGAPAEIEALIQSALDRAPYEERLLRRAVENLKSAGRPGKGRALVSKFRERMQRDLSCDITEELKLWLDTALPQASVTLARESQKAEVCDPPQLPKVVVLGLQDHAPGPIAAVARAMLTEVSLALCSMRTFAMLAPYTAKQINGRDPLEQAAALGAKYAVTTELLAGGRLAFTVLQIATRRILAADVVRLVALDNAASELGQSIAAAVSSHIMAEEISVYRRTGEASAYVHYVIGCERLRYDLPSIRKARKSFLRALDLHPHFAQAKALLAKTMSLEWLVLRRSEKELLETGLRLAEESVQIDPLIPAGHWSMATSLLYLNRMDESLEQIQRARVRAPHLADLLADEGDLYVHAGELDLALERIDEAMSLNPLPPDDYYWLKGSAQFLRQDYHDALRTLEKMGDQRQVARMMAGSAAMIGDAERAERYRGIWMEMYPDFRVSDWAGQMPLKNRDHVEGGIEAMRKAGFL